MASTGHTGHQETTERTEAPGFVTPALRAFGEPDRVAPAAAGPRSGRDVQHRSIWFRDRRSEVQRPSGVFFFLFLHEVEQMLFGLKH